MRPIDWIFDNLQIIALVAAGIVSLLARRKKAAEADEVEQHMPPPLPVDESDLDRRIREEIARKRAEREGRPATVQPTLRPDSPPIDEDRDQAPGLDEWAEPEPVAEPKPQVPSPLSRRQEAAREDAEAALARQLELQEKFAALERERALVRAEAKAINAAAYDTPTLPVPPVRMTGRSVLTGLRHPEEVRRAILYSEIMGRPKSLTS